MKQRFWIVAVVALAACVALTGQVMSQEGKKPEMPPGMPDMQEMMKAWAAVKDPGAGHKKLEPLVGTWETTSRMYMGGPGTPPTETHGSATVKWILGGRFIQEDFKGQIIMPDPSGQMKPGSFEGMGLTGHDNFRNVYNGTWVDSMGTCMLSFSGTSDPQGKDFNFYGQMDEPGMKMAGRTIRYHTRIIDNDKHVFEMYDLAAGPDYKVFEITYTRKK